MLMLRYLLRPWVRIMLQGSGEVGQLRCDQPAAADAHVARGGP